MKKVITIACCVVLATTCVLLAGCSGGSGSASASGSGSASGSASASAALTSASAASASASASAASAASASAASESASAAAVSQYVGTWVASKAVFRDEEVTVEEVIGGDLTLELLADGTANLISPEQTTTGQWTETSKGVKIKGDDINLTLVAKDGGLDADIVLGFHFFFEKQQ